MAEVAPPVFQQKEVVIGAALLALLLLWLHCRTNPPGETCGKPEEPIYPPPILLHPPSPPPPRRCLDFPGRETPPFPCCYSAIAETPTGFPHVRSGKYTFLPDVHKLKDGKGSGQIWALFGWFARDEENPDCDQISNDPSYDGRFHLVQNPDECGGIYGC